MKRVPASQRFVRYVAIILWCFSVLAMLGWLLHIDILTQVHNDLPTMKFNTAACFFLLACVIFCTRESHCFRISGFLNVVLFLISFVTLAQYIGGFSIGIDQFVVTDEKGILNGNGYPGRMSAATALCFLLLSISLGMIRQDRAEMKKWASYFSMVAVVISFLAIIGFVYYVPTFAKIGFMSSMAIHTAIAFFLAGIGISLITYRYGITELFTSKRIGSFMIRKMFFRLLIITLVISYAILYCYRKGYFAADFSIAMVSVAVIFTALILLVIVSRDINKIDREKRAAEEELNIIYMYLNATPDPLMVINKQGNIELANALLQDVFGYAEDELRGKTMDFFITERYHEQYRQHLEKYFEFVDSTNQKGREYHGSSVIEIVITKKNGTELPVEMALNSTWAPNGLITVAVFRDISRRVYAEDKLQVALEASIVGIWDYDIEHGKLYWDDTMYKLYGIESGNEAAPYELWANMVHPDDVGKIETLLQDSIAGHSVYDTDFRIVWTDGSIRHVRAKGTVYRDENKKAIRMLGTNWDITQQKNMEASLIEAKYQAEAASKSKSEFLANMSHEIRTPLNGIIGFTDLLVKTPLNDSQAEYLKNVNSSANLLLDVINDILDFSKIEAGKLELHYEEVDIYELCEQTIDVIRHQAEKKKLEVLLNISAGIQRYVYADAVRLRQVLTNLLSNAIKFTDQGEIELRLNSKASGDEKEKTYFQFIVRDTGIGIPADKLLKIFGAFDQEDSSTTRKYGGTGLGLAISNKLLALMDSKLDVQSEPNTGSEFSFEVEFEISGRKETENIVVKRSIKKVLIVDDNESNRHILEAMLAEMDINTVSAANGIEALELLEKQKDFDFAIVDYNMPYMSGTTLISHIRKTLKLSAADFPIMILHSTADDEIIFKAIKEYGIAFNYIKPIHFGKLKTVLDRLENPTSAVKDTSKKEVNTISGARMSFGKENITILIVEDNPVNQFLAKEILVKIVPDARLVIAENGEEALKKYEEENPNLVFMDIQMPVLNGLDATVKIREIEKTNGKHIPIIALTARALNDERETCLEYGMDDYLSKPIVLDRVKHVVEEYLLSKF
ncbi:response regulator [Flavobacterium rakeshii]|uniref:response regulator n=1 Tax=Flavobacterium rakeshii TaxID=1038845 RepID=UPI002E7C1993|nr:response regulator [Flavobacterium rakeshii]MEE1896991.1 response regulator [Flavobacterium rakeshii]